MHTNDIAEASYGMKILGQTSAGSNECWGGGKIMAGESEKSPNRSEPILTDDMTILSKGRAVAGKKVTRPGRW